MIGGGSRPSMIWAMWAVMSSMPTLATNSGCSLASGTVRGSLGHPGAMGSYPASRKRSSQDDQLVACNQSPWMKTAGLSALAMRRPLVELPTTQLVSAAGVQDLFNLDP